MPHRILLVEDDPIAREALADLLRDDGYEVVTAENGAVALSLLDRFVPDAVLTDLAMPHLGGLELIPQLRKHPDLSNVPVLVVSALDDSARRVEGFHLGADDFVPKPVNAAELTARLARHLYRSSRERQATLESVSDQLTGMLNRRGITNFFNREQLRCRSAGEPLSILLVDIDRFKPINDRFGHAAGDHALAVVARTLQDVVRATDRVGRVGGDEFLIVLPQVDPDGLRELTRRVLGQTPIESHVAAGHTVRLFLSVGAATLREGESLERLMERADQAMYAHKQRRGPENG